jgi:molybdopterin-guanine dinucleotide biosynthesis protein A
VAHRALIGVLLVGGASTRFGSPKALAHFDGQTLADRAWHLLGEACDERIAVGKRDDGLELPFDVLDDGTEVRAPIAGVVAGLRAATHDALPELERALADDRLALRAAIAELDVEIVELDAALLVNVNTPDDVQRL